MKYAFQLNNSNDYKKYLISKSNNSGQYCFVRRRKKNLKNKLLENLENLPKSRKSLFGAGLVASKLRSTTQNPGKCHKAL